MFLEWYTTLLQPYMLPSPTCDMASNPVVHSFHKIKMWLAIFIYEYGIMKVCSLRCQNDWAWQYIQLPFKKRRFFVTFWFNYLEYYKTWMH
jgi:hypothetical protein